MSSVALRDSELAILNAPFEADGWRRAVVSIAETTRSAGAQLLGLGGPLVLPLNTVVGAYAGYESYFGDPDLHGRSNWRVSTTNRPMEIQHEAHYARYRQAHDTSDYDDAVADLDMPHGAQSALIVDSNMMLGLALLRSRRDGPCDADVLRSFAILRTQVSRAVRVQIALDGEAAEMMMDGPSATSGSTILLDRHGNLCALTPPAESLIEQAGPIRLDGLAIRLRDRAEDHHFQAAIARLMKADGHRDMMVHEARVGRRCCALGLGWKLIAIRLPRRDHGLGFDAHVAVTLHGAASRAA